MAEQQGQGVLIAHSTCMYITFTQCVPCTLLFRCDPAACHHVHTHAHREGGSSKACRDNGISCPHVGDAYVRTVPFVLTCMCQYTCVCTQRLSVECFGFLAGCLAVCLPVGWCV